MFQTTNQILYGSYFQVIGNCFQQNRFAALCSKFQVAANLIPRKCNVAKTGQNRYYCQVRAKVHTVALKRSVLCSR